MKNNTLRKADMTPKVRKALAKRALDGVNGLDGLPGVNGTDGTNGADGLDGRSAYDLAVEAGFEGTLEEWLDSLQGVDGREFGEPQVGAVDPLVVEGREPVGDLARRAHDQAGVHDRLAEPASVGGDDLGPLGVVARQGHPHLHRDPGVAGPLPQLGDAIELVHGDVPPVGVLAD